MKRSINLMNLDRLHHQAKLMYQAPRCSATSKRSGHPLPSTGSPGLERVPMPRSTRRSADGTN